MPLTGIIKDKEEKGTRSIKILKQPIFRENLQRLKKLTFRNRGRTIEPNAFSDYEGTYYKMKRR